MRHGVGGDGDGVHLRTLPFGSPDCAKRTDAVQHRHRNIKNKHVCGGAVHPHAVPFFDGLCAVCHHDDVGLGIDKHFVQNTPVCRGIISHKKAYAFKVRDFRLLLVWFAPHRAGHALNKRQNDPHRCALSRCAVNRDLAAHQINQLADNGHSKTGSTKSARCSALGLLKAKVDACNLFGGHANPGVAHLNHKRLAFTHGHRQRNRASIGEFDRVA